MKIHFLDIFFYFPMNLQFFTWFMHELVSHAKNSYMYLFVILLFPRNSCEKVLITICFPIEFVSLVSTF